MSITGIYIFFIAESHTSIPYFSKDGVLNLEKLDWSENKIIELNGEWKYYNNLLKEDLNDKTPYIIKIVPHFWEADSDINFSPYNFGTYKLRITGLRQGEIYALEVPDEATAYTLFANNEKVVSNGIVSKEASTSVPQWKPKVSVFETDAQGEVEFVMEISNFQYFRGGFWKSIKMGAVSDILIDNNRNITIEMFLFIPIFIAGLISFGLFFIYGREKVNLYFGVFCFCMSFRTLLTGQRIIFDMISIFSWDILTRVEYLLTYLLVPCFGLFIMQLFEVRGYKVILERFFKIIIIIFFGVTLFASNYVYSIVQYPYKYGAIVFSVYLIYLTYKAIKNGQLGAKLLLFANLGMLVSLLQETFIRGTIHLVPFASIIFIFCFLLITFQKFLEVTRRNSILESTSILDTLTGLYNRNYISQLNADYFKIEENKNYSVMFLDLDKFKYINDTFGHEIGDFVLKETGGRLKRLLGNKGMICRYGGDEIIIIINSNAKNVIVNVAKGIIESITKPIKKDGISYEIGVSIGIAESNDEVNDIETLIKRSDEAMYEAKKSGGNQYSICDI